jgi:hypothetical protein
MLLQVLDDGFLTDSLGRKIDLKNTNNYHDWMLEQDIKRFGHKVYLVQLQEL